ncbi:MAG: iron-sulfur cluster co-chaperone HscB C-terminal domain-containing protein [Planctomycetota bacterium]
MDDASGALRPVPEDVSPFAILGLAPSMEVDAKDLGKRLRAITRRVHPDFYATAGEEERALAERNNAALNEAYETIADPARRADHLVRSLGGPTEKDLGDMPQAFLMEVMEWNEVLEEAVPGSPDLASLATELEQQREQTLARIQAALTPLPPAGDSALAEVRRALNALRYLERALSRARA